MAFTVLYSMRRAFVRRRRFIASSSASLFSTFDLGRVAFTNARRSFGESILAMVVVVFVLSLLKGL
jgi:hypothetical protein